MQELTAANGLTRIDGADGLSDWDGIAARAFAAAPVGMAIVDAATGAFLHANPALCAFLGRSREELARLTVHDVTLPEDRAVHADGLLRRSRRTTGPMSDEKRYLRPDGTVAWASLTIAPLPGRGGRQRTFAIVEDISRGRRAGGEPRALPLAQQWLLDQVPAAVYLRPLDDAPPTYLSPRIEDITGYPAEGLRVRRDVLLPYVHPDDRPAVDAAIAESDRSLEPFVATYRLRRADGRWIWLHERSEIVRDDDGAPLHRQGMVEDVTARKEAEAALAAREAQFRSAFEDAAIGMALVAPDGRFLDANPALCRFFGRDRKDLLQRTFQELTHPDDLDADLAALGRLLAGEADRYRLDKRYLRADGAVAWGRLHVSTVRDAGGAVVRFVSQIEDVTAARQAEQALHALQARFDVLAERIPAGVAIYPLAGPEPGYVSPRLAAMTGWTADEIRAGALRPHPDDAARVHALDREAERTLQPYSVDSRIRHRDGRWLWIHEESEVVRDEAGEPQHWLSIVLDRTAEKAAEAALAERQALFRSTFADSAIGMAIVGPDAAILEANPAMCTLLGYTPEELRGLTYRELTAPEFVAENAAGFDRLLRGEADAFQVEKRYLRRDGSAFWGRLHVSAVRDAGGRLLRAVTQIEDVTARREAEAARSESEALFRSTFEDAAIGMAISDPQGTLLAVNPAFAAMLGRTAGELVGRPAGSLSHPEDRHAEREALLPALASGADRAHVEKRYLRADGSTLWGSLNLSAVRDAAGEVVRVVAQVEDVTARKAAELRYRRLVEQIPAAVFILPLETGAPASFISPRIEELTGYRPEELPAEREFLRNLAHPEDIAANDPLVAAAERDGTPLTIQYRLRRKDGRWIWVLDSFDVVRDDAGRPVCWQGVLIDVTAERELRQALAESEALFRSTFDDAAIGMAIVDADSRTLDANPALCRMLGYTREEMRAVGFREATAPAYVEENAAAIARVRAGEADTYRLEKEYVRKDGSTFWGSLNASAVRGPGGELLRTVVQIEDITARRQAENALADSEARFRSIFENAAIGMGIIGPDGTLLDVNPAVTRVFGHAREAAVGRSVAEFSHPGDYAADAEALRRLVAGEVPAYTREKRFRHADGHWVWSRTNVAAVRDVHGAMTTAVAVVEDISERKAAEAALAESEALFRSTFEDAAIGMAIATSGGLLLDVNPAFCRLLGRSRDELLAMDFAAFTHPDDLAREMAEVVRLRAGEIDHYQLEKRYLRKDGGIVWVAFTGSCVRGPHGEITLAIGQVEDITARREAEAALAESEARFSALVQRSTDAFMISRPEGGVVWVSPAIRNIIGRDLEVPIDVNTAGLIHPDDAPEVDRMRREVRVSQDATSAVEIRVRHADGSWRWVEIRATNHTDNPAVDGIVYNLRDLTERKSAERAVAAALALQQRANAELREAASQRAGFLAMLAHDFRSPLTAIQGYAELLAMDPSDPADVQESAAIIVRSAERLNRMVGDMLEVESLEERMGHLRRAPTDVAALVADAVSALHGGWPDRDIEIDAEPGLPPVALDRDQVTQATINLVGNALKYSPGGEPVSVTVRRVDDAVEIAVADRGIGIPADKLEAVFDKYSRVRSKETAGIEGVGLGLPIVRAVARAHGGEAWAESEPGAGSTFRLRLPVAPAAGNGTDA